MVSIRRLLDALCFDEHESGSSPQTVKGKATVGAHQVCIGSPFGRSHIHIGVGFGVARFDCLGMPEPLKVGRVTRELPTSSFLYVTCLNFGAL